MDMEETLEGFIWLSPDFPVSAYPDVCAVLQSADCCVAGYHPPQVGFFDLGGQLYQKNMLGMQTVLLPDRGVVSRCAQLARGHRVTTDQQLRYAAALLVFCRCADILIEPSVAFHELAHKQSNEVAWDELGWFRTADNACCDDLIEVALGRKDKLSEQHSPRPVSRTDLAGPLKRWRRNYILALKIAELECTQLRPLERVKALLEWMETDFIFGGPAALLGCLYLAPNSPPRAGLFKQLRSANRVAALDGVRNMAWDLTHLSDFVLRVNEANSEERKRYIFASFDNNFRNIVRVCMLASYNQEEQLLEEKLAQWWPEDDAAKIVAALMDSIQRISGPDWSAKEAPVPNYVDVLIERGENTIKNLRFSQA